MAMARITPHYIRVITVIFPVLHIMTESLVMAVLDKPQTMISLDQAVKQVRLLGSQDP